MGFGDRLKGLKDQAQQTVSENRDRIQGAVQSAGEAANTKTHGKYAERIAKLGEKVSAGVERFGAGADDPETYHETTAAEVPEAPEDLIHPKPPSGPPPEFD